MTNYSQSDITIVSASILIKLFRSETCRLWSIMFIIFDTLVRFQNICSRRWWSQRNHVPLEMFLVDYFHIYLLNVEEMLYLCEYILTFIQLLFSTKSYQIKSLRGEMEQSYFEYSANSYHQCFQSYVHPQSYQNSKKIKMFY